MNTEMWRKKDKDYYKPHYVYLIGNKRLNYYKIGIAFNIERRIRGLSLPFETELLAKVTLPNRGKALTTEQHLHHLYRNFNIRGEWFRDIDPKHFVYDAEYLVAGDHKLAEKRVNGNIDGLVLRVLKTKGLESAKEFREKIA